MVPAYAPCFYPRNAVLGVMILGCSSILAYAMEDLKRWIRTQEQDNDACGFMFSVVNQTTAPTATRSQRTAASRTHKHMQMQLQIQSAASPAPTAP